MFYSSSISPLCPRPTLVNHEDKAAATNQGSTNQIPFTNYHWASGDHMTRFALETGRTNGPICVCKSHLARHNIRSPQPAKLHKQLPLLTLQLCCPAEQKLVMDIVGQILHAKHWVCTCLAPLHHCIIRHHVANLQTVLMPCCLQLGGAAGVHPNMPYLCHRAHEAAGAQAPETAAQQCSTAQHSMTQDSAA